MGSHMRRGTLGARNGIRLTPCDILVLRYGKYRDLALRALPEHKRREVGMKRRLMMCMVVVALGVLILGGGCGEETEVAETGTEPVHDLLNSFYDAYNQRDYDTCLAYVTDCHNSGEARNLLESRRSSTGPVLVETVNVTVSGWKATAFVTLKLSDTGHSCTNQVLLKDIGLWQIAWEVEGEPEPGVLPKADTQS